MSSRRPIRRLSALLAAGALISTPLIGALPAEAASETIVINEVYARGGSANQPY